MLTASFYREAGAALVQRSEGAGAFFMAIGSGVEEWDDAGLPTYARETTQLVSEIARKAVDPANMRLLGMSDAEANGLSPGITFTAVFESGEGVGSVRECGLYGGQATSEPGSGALLSYFNHPRIEKTEAMTLSRTVRIDLTPRPFVPGTRATRYLANTGSTELHDLDNQTPGCQIDEIRFDRRYFFRTVEEAAAAGYDFCAFCFGAELSQR